MGDWLVAAIVVVGAGALGVAAWAVSAAYGSWRANRLPRLDRLMRTWQP